MEEEEEEKLMKATTDNPVESTEPAADEPGTSAGSGRFYDCIFCKRGFTTAQALGGHMNIHRKDRTRLRPTGSSSSGPRREEEAYHPYARAQRAAPNQPVDQPNYVVYFPASSEESSQRSTELQLGLGGSGPKEEEEKKELKEDLDLELRLGHSSKSHESSSNL